MNGGEDECMEDIGEKARRKETTRKTKTGVMDWIDLVQDEDR
jgi:hypothetical protein